MLKTLIGALSIITASGQVQVITNVTNLKNIEMHKINVNSIKVNPAVVNLSKEEENFEVIRDLVFTELLIANEDNEYVEDIIFSMWFEEDNWKFQSMNYVKPNEGERLTYKSRAVAIPSNIMYSGVFKFDITLINEPDIQRPETIKVNGESNDVIVDTIVDKRSRWMAKNGEIINIKLDNYGVKNDQELIENYSYLNINYNFKHEDDAKHGHGEIQNTLNETKTVDLGKLVNHNELTYPDTISDSKAQDIYNNTDESLFENGVIKKYQINYTQNKIWAFYAIDTIYNQQQNSIQVRSTNIAGKYRSGANQANVHSKITTKINYIEIKK
ncbi:hypothetical protein [Spiroplasma endosymbiont of Diplazon laetatorius]|uniref:hypothetical protein n=1 Tax=Spiroplasma endosymbiont of Diplazon laetatorius TaxID=3066322 RepID=UPI0030D18A13